MDVPVFSGLVVHEHLQVKDVCRLLQDLELLGKESSKDANFRPSGVIFELFELAGERHVVEGLLWSC